MRANAGAKRRAGNFKDKRAAEVRVRLSDLLGAAPPPAASARLMPASPAPPFNQRRIRRAHTAQPPLAFNRAGGALDFIASQASRWRRST
jgi:hypothetical protein